MITILKQSILNIVGNMKMIKLSDKHYIVVDDSEIKEDKECYFISNQSKLYFHKGKNDKIVKRNKEDVLYEITHSTQPLEEICCTPDGQIKRYVDCKGCNKKQLGFVKYDVAIIGSGLMGLWTALELKQRQPNLSVIILEKDSIPTGASTPKILLLFAHPALEKSRVSFNRLNYDKIKPLSLSEVEEAINGCSVEEMAENKYPINPFYDGEELCHPDTNDELREGYIEGFKAHQELVKDKLFTIEDMKRIYEKGYSAGRSELSSRESDKIKYDYIQSLLPKTEWDIEITPEGKIKLI